MDLPSRHFRPRIYGVGAWTDHLHFAYDLIATLKPRLFVELGTDRGESYFAFCQSVAENKTGTRCFAVDTWRGDQHAGSYDETTYEEVASHNASSYQEFSILLRRSFDEALREFAPESIDVLHLDGLHTEEAVRHDVDAWLPKLAPGGLLLMHDVSVRTRNFGVWKVWEDLGSSGRAYAFKDGAGLGVWQKSPAAPLAVPLEALLAEPSDVAARLEVYYRDRARGLQEQMAQHWKDGSIRETAVAHQTIIQVFHTNDGIHREEDTVAARIGHESWKTISLMLPPDAGAKPLRIDFLSALTLVDIAELRLVSEDQICFVAEDLSAFEKIAVAGDAVRRDHPSYLRVQITGVDPQLYLPAIDLPGGAQATFTLRLRVCLSRAPD